jgi:hypothetical protein
MGGNMADLSWLNRAVDLSEAGREEETLDLVYDTIDMMLLSGKFNACNQILQEIDPSHLSTDILLIMTTVTFAAHNHLPYRKIFVGKVGDVLEERGLPRVILLDGLEGE